MRVTWFAAGAALSASVLFAAASASAQSGSFQGSCRNVTALGGGAISAECLDGGGRYRSSTLAAGQCQGDIGNQNGMLACNGATASGGAYVPDPPKNRNRDRSNDDEFFTGGRGGGYGYGGRQGQGFQSRGGVIAGSYQSSCRYGETLPGGYLTAECLDNSRRYRNSTIQYTACRSDISNQNGLLACQGAVATGGAYLRD